MRRLIVAVMLAMLMLPLPLGLLAGHGPASIGDAMTSRALVGEREVVVPTFDIVEPRPFQSAVADLFARLIYPRNLIVRITNQIYYDLFYKAYTASAKIVVGKHENLFSDGYVEAYCGPDLGDDTERFKPLVDDLKVINDRLTELGRPFLFLITPSKAAAMPEAMPIGSCITNKARGRELKHLVAELRAAGVPVVNGPALTKKRKKHDPIPPFPRGGIHWSLGVGDHVARQVMLELARIARQDLGSVKITGTQWDAPPVGSDRDLAELLNLLAAPADYPTARNDVACRLTDAGKSTELRVVGGSFANTIFRKLDECQFFSPATMHFYYWDEPGTVDWKEILSRRSVLIVELNEVYLGRPDPKAWLPKFFDDIIPVLEQM